MKPTTLLTTAAVVLLAGQVFAKPNIVLILADDLGYSDLGCYGGEVQTPNLDALAKSGVRFARFYNAGRCCPTRASLLTGLFPHQAGIGHMNYDAGEPGYRGDLNRDTATIAEVLKAGGYTTGMAGKWHLTPHTKPEDDRSNWPRQRGFDHFYGTLPGHGSLWDPAGLYLENEPVKAGGDDYFYTEAIADHASAFIERSAKKASPFFLYVAFTAPHYPLHARKKTIAKYDGVYDQGWDVLREKRFARLKNLGLLPAHAKLPPRDEGSIPWKDDPNKKWQAHRMQVFAAMVDEMDQAIGKILDKLKTTDTADNTIVVFLSDNGGSPEGHLNNTIERLEKPWKSAVIPKTTPDGKPVIPGDIPDMDLGGAHTYGSYGLRWSSLSNTPFRRHKAWMHEGGIASPCIINWPGKITKPGRITRQNGHIIDLMPTFLELADTAHPEQKTPLAGISLLPVLQEKPLSRETLAWEHEGNRAFRSGKWKLVSEFPGTWKFFYPYEKKGAWELYDLEADPTELNDLAPSQPEKVKQLEESYETWRKKTLVVPWEMLKKKKI
nr:arylsulfatase-like [Nerophis lumbriciformis]